MNKDLNELTEAELAEWQYAHRDELDAEEGEEAEVEFAPQVSVTMSFRLSGAEADTIRDAAREAGLSLSEWIRRTAADAMRPDGGRRNRNDVDKELLKTERELDAMRKRLEAIRKKTRLNTKTAGKVVMRKQKKGVAASRTSRATRSSQ